MGTKIYDLVERHEIAMADLAGKVIAIDTFLFLYQFLATIRQPDGRLLTDTKGNVTSHLVGLFARSAHFLAHQLKPVFVFDGEPPVLKKAVRDQRRLQKVKAQEKFEEAQTLGDEEAMKKYGARTSTLSQEMIAEAQELVMALGMPVVLAPSEGEAQAAYMVRKGDAYAVGSNDADALLFGATRIIKNLGATGKKKKPGTLVRETVPLELIELDKTLSALKLTHDQLIYLAMLVGTDYNPGGIKGIGPKKALDLVRKQTDPIVLFGNVAWDFPHSWKDVYHAIKHVAVTDNYSLVRRQVDQKRVIALLCDRHDFAQERVEKTLAPLKPTQATLGGFI
ncbi:flap endonuclease-1 [Candidatus Woesearchaeota archaeon]|nr:flap endonuclease-1 [Candidatus Woesearchaeota archaeon]